MDSSRARAQDLISHRQPEDRDRDRDREREGPDRAHDEKKKAKAPKKPIKKKKEEDVGLERANLETSEDVQVFSPKKGQKKKNIEKKRKRSKGDSDVSDEEMAPQSKKKRGPRTPPLAIKEELIDICTDKDGMLEEDPLKKEETAFSDWSDEDVPDRTEGMEPEHTAAAATPGSTPSPLSSLLPPPPPVAAASTAATALASSSASAATTSALVSSSAVTASASEDSHRKGHRTRGVEKGEACHVTLEETPHRKLVDQKRSSSLGSNRSHRSHTSGRLRSPSNDSAHRSGDDQSSRKRVLHSGSRDRDKTKSLEITGERKSRIDQLKRGEPSRSTSSGNEVEL